LLHEYLQKIPREGDKVTIGNVTIVVEEIEKNIPLRITVRKAGEGEDTKIEKAD
jgi:CBS domain containing-hemolysin-like protein